MKIMDPKRKVFGGLDHLSTDNFKKATRFIEEANKFDKVLDLNFEETSHITGKSLLVNYHLECDTVLALTHRIDYEEDISTFKEIVTFYNNLKVK